MFGPKGDLLAIVFSVALAPAPVEWTWDAPAGCPLAGAVERRFAALAPRSCRQVEPGPLRIAAVAVRLDGRWRLDLSLRRGDRAVDRTLTARDCAALVEATAVIVAAACPTLAEAAPTELSPETGEVSELSPETGEAAPADASELSPGTGDAPPPEGRLPGDTEELARIPLRPEPAATRPRSPDPRARDEALARPAAAPAGGRAAVRTGLELGARVAAAWGPTPAPAALLGLGLRVQWRAVDLALAVEYGPRRRVGEPSGPAIDLRLVSAAAAGCPALELGRGRRRGRASLCLGLELGALVGTGVGTPVTRTVARPWLAAFFGPALVWSVHRRVRLGAAVDVAASLTRPAYVLDGFGIDYRAAAAAVRLRMILAVQLR